MEIKFENPVCKRCVTYLPEGFYQWVCPECYTHYKAEKYARETENGPVDAWFEYRPVEGKMPNLPMGLSQWREHGDKYGYTKYFQTLFAKFYKERLFS